MGEGYLGCPHSPAVLSLVLCVHTVLGSMEGRLGPTALSLQRRGCCGSQALGERNLLSLACTLASLGAPGIPVAAFPWGWVSQAVWKPCLGLFVPAWLGERQGVVEGRFPWDPGSHLGAPAEQPCKAVLAEWVLAASYQAVSASLWLCLPMCVHSDFQAASRVCVVIRVFSVFASEGRRGAVGCWKCLCYRKAA